MFRDRLSDRLRAKGICENKIAEVSDSGYIIRRFYDPFSGKCWDAVSDMMYGNKGQSSHFDIDKFIKYIHGENTFDPLSPFVEYRVKTWQDIEKILLDKARRGYIERGMMSFRGQPSEHKFQRKLPNPVRSDKSGEEISIFPGVYRQNSGVYSFNAKQTETRTFEEFLPEIEPNNPDVYFDSSMSYDIMRVEQHYATQTAGLDISFDIDTALFFATHKFKRNPDKTSYYERIRSGSHEGVIYGFCFRDPLVKKTEYLVKKFDLFKTYKPERVIRQECGLPLFDEYERNIAITDLDFIIYLDPDFDFECKKSPEYMFPNISEDQFYGRLLELKDKFPEQLSNLVEYEWAR